MATINLSTLIFRAHELGDTATTPNVNGSGGSGVTLNAIKFRAWQAPGQVTVEVGPGTGVGGNGPDGGAIAGGGGTVVVDDFNDNVLNPVLWTPTTQTNGSIIEQNGRLEFHLNPTAGAGSTLVLTSSTFSIYNRTWGFSVPIEGSSPWSFIFNGTNQGFAWNPDTNTLSVFTTTAGTQNFVLATMPTYYRIRHVADAYIFPYIQGFIDTHITTAGLNFNVNVSNGIQIGDLLIVGISASVGLSGFGWPVYSSTGTVIGFTGLGPGQWKSLTTGTTGITRMEVGYLPITSSVIAAFDGTNDVVPMQHSNTSAHKAAFAYLIRGSHATSVPQGAGNGAGTTNAITPALTPTWGSENNLWIIFSAFSGGVLPSAFPSTYTEGRVSDRTATTNISHATAYKLKNSGSDPIESFTNAVTSWRTGKIAIRPEIYPAFGTYYYEISYDGITWQTLFSERAPSLPAEGQFVITVTRDAGEGPDIVAFDNFFLVITATPPIPKITVPVPPSISTASVTAPTHTPNNAVIVSPPASASAFGNAIIILTPGLIESVAARSRASIGSSIGNATVTVLEIFADASASNVEPVINTTDGVNEKFIFLLAPNAIASVFMPIKANITISEVVAEANADGINIVSPVADNPTALASEAEATAFVATPTVINTHPAVESIAATAQANSGAPLPLLRVPSVAASSNAGNTAPTWSKDPNTIFPASARGRAISSPSPRILTEITVAIATASVSAPNIMSQPQFAEPAIALAEIVEPTIVMDAISAAFADATASVVAPNVAIQPILTPIAEAAASINSPILTGDQEDMLSFPEDSTDSLWAGNLDGQTYDDTMPHTGEG